MNPPWDVCNPVMILPNIHLSEVAHRTGVSSR